LIRQGACQTQSTIEDTVARCCAGMYGALFASFPPPPPPEEGQQISALPTTVSPSFQVHSHVSAQPPYVLAEHAASHWTCGGGPERSGDRATKRSGDELMSAPTERAKRKKLMRQGQKDLLILLDSILHVGDGGEDAPCSAHTCSRPLLVRVLASPA